MNELTFSTNPRELAADLDEYATDWYVVLEFLDTVAKKRGIPFFRNGVLKIMRERYSQEVVE